MHGLTYIFLTFMTSQHDFNVQQETNLQNYMS